MRNDYFFYGTLRHMPLLEVVLGRSVDTLTFENAALSDHAVFGVQDQLYPMLAFEVGHDALGLLVRGLTQDDLDRMAFYEGGFNYDVQTIEVIAESGATTAQVFFPDASVGPGGDPWTLEAWTDRWGALTVLAAREVMGFFGKLPADDVQRMFPMIRARAAATQNAETSLGVPTPSGLTISDVTELERTQPYTDYFAMRDHRISYPRFDGGQGPVLPRAVLVATDVSIVLPYDPVRDRVLLIEQFRVGPYARGDKVPWCLEPVAGRMDPGETPEETAYRETREETGLQLKHLEEVARCYPSAGATTEYFNIFVGIADLPDDAARAGGLETEDEDILGHIYSFDALMEMVDKQQAVIAPLVIAALWLSRHRDRLRGVA